MFLFAALGVLRVLAVALKIHRKDAKNAKGH